MSDVLEGIKGGLAPLVVFAAGLLALLFDLSDAKSRLRSWGAAVASCGLLASGVVSVVQATAGGVRLAPLESVAGGGLFGGVIVQDGFSAVLCALIGVTGALILGMGESWRSSKSVPAGEFRALICFASAGAMWMAQSVDLVTAFVSVEVLSVAVYVLVGMSRGGARSGEAAVKYFLMGAFASAFLLFGIALIYGAVGLVRTQIGLPLTASLTNLGVISETLVVSADKATPLAQFPLFGAGIALLLVGLGFKASLVPFHQYAPDVYDGAPIPVAAFLATVTKFGAFGVVVRMVQSLAMPSEPSAVVLGVLGTIAIVSMLVGNAAALGQSRLRRLLAFSSTAHAGYLLAGCVGLLSNRGQLLSSEAVLGYLMAYGLTNIGIFAVLQWLGDVKRPVDDLSDLAGLGLRHRGAAVSLTVLLLSLAGFPLTFGFVSKLSLFLAMVDAGQIFLAVAGLLASGIGVAVYLKIVIVMFFKQPSESLLPMSGGISRLVAVGSVAFTLLFGVMPLRWIDPVPNPTVKSVAISSASKSAPVPVPASH